jgi:AraC-like DNA-binding protein
MRLSREKQARRRKKPLERGAGSDGEKKSAGQFSEAAVWAQAHGEWRRIYGDYDACGVSMEWHEFSLGQNLSIAESVHPGSLELCLNLEGVMEIPTQAKVVRAGECAWYAAESGWKACRLASQRHLFVTVEINPAWLTENLQESERGALHKELGEFLDGKRKGLLRTGVLSRRCGHLLRTLETAGPPGVARRLWLQSRFWEILCSELFPPLENTSTVSRAQRTARQLADKTRAILAENLEEPPSLQELARRVGCSPFHLSRLFTQATGQTITRYVRQLRLERAAELLESGRFNVTETALEVGYSSLSHFSKAFAEHFGHCPCRFNLEHKDGRE